MYVCMYVYAYIHQVYMDHVAHALSMSPEIVREKNMYASRGAVTPYGQPLVDCHAKDMWSEVCLACNIFCNYVHG